MEVCIFVLVWKLDNFGFPLLYKSLYKSKILPTEVDLVSLFSRFRKRRRIHARPCFTTRPRPFSKEELWHFLIPPLSLTVSHVVARLKVSFRWIVEKFGKFFEKTFSKDMLYEARTLAQFQVASGLNCSDADFCLLSDGTISKKGHLYIMYIMMYGTSKKSGEVFVVGLREVGSGEAQVQLDLLKEVVGDISNASSKSNFSDSYLFCINKKFNVYRCSALPKKKLVHSQLIIKIQCYLKLNLTWNFLANLKKVNIWM